MTNINNIANSLEIITFMVPPSITKKACILAIIQKNMAR